MSQYHNFVITLGGASATRPTYYILAYYVRGCVDAVYGL